MQTATIDNHMEPLERIRVQFDPRALDHLQILFTDLYSDQQTAVVREYSTNAWDSHIDAGKTDTPIEVTTPTFMVPFLKIRDYGVGMDIDDIRNVYSYYGASTKREQTTTNGSMGIGAKSALTLSAQFTVTGIKNGVKTQVSVTREADNSIYMDIVDISETTDPNGVVITIPVTASALKDKAEKFFRYWEKGRVLLNGEDPSKLHELKKISERVYLDTDNYHYADHDIIFMGNVPYMLQRDFDVIRPEQGIYVAMSTMNSPDQVVFTPTREGLIYNDITNSAIESFTKEINDHILTLLSAELDACATKSEAFRKYHDMVSRYNHASVVSLTYKGEKVPQRHSAIQWKNPDGSLSRYTLTWDTNRTRRAVDGGGYLSMSGASFIVINFPENAKGLSPQHKRKIRQYVSEGDFYAKRVTGGVLFLRNDGSTVENGEWISHKFIDWNEIKKIRLVTDSGGGEYYGRPSRNGGYTVVNGTNFTEEVRHDLKSDAKIIYYSPRDGYGGGMLTALTRQIPDAILVCEPVNRHGKLQRTFPKAMTVSAARALASKNVVSKVTEREWMEILRMDRGLSPKLFTFLGEHVDQINDPKLAEYIKSGESVTLSLDARDAAVLGARPEKTPKPLTYNLVANYALLHHVVDNTYSLYRAPKTEVIEYVNAHYERKNS